MKTDNSDESYWILGLKWSRSELADPTLSNIPLHTEQVLSLTDETFYLNYQWRREESTHKGFILHFAEGLLIFWINSEGVRYVYFSDVDLKPN